MGHRPVFLASDARRLSFDVAFVHRVTCDFRVFVLSCAVPDVQGLRLRYAHSYAQLEEESMLDVFLCRDGNGGEDGTCAGVKSFVREVQAVARRSLALIVRSRFCWCLFLLRGLRGWRGVMPRRGHGDQHMPAAFVCRDGNDGEDDTCAGVKSFVSVSESIGVWFYCVDYLGALFEKRSSTVPVRVGGWAGL